MRITELTEQAKVNFAKALVANELGNQLSLVYRFSDADGVRTGKSGWSFGIVQFDINNNANALLCLKECDFTTDEMAALRRQDADVQMSAMDAKLLAHREVVDRWDRRQIQACLTWPMNLCTELGVDFSDEETLLHVADYHNQFGMSRGGKMYRWLQAITGAVTAEMVRDFKYTLPWGVKQKAKNRQHDDVWRRYANIVRITGA
jgi:hypothetical protein